MGEASDSWSDAKCAHGGCGDHPRDAEVVLIACGDRRTTRSCDMAIIEVEVDRLAAHFGIIREGEQADFDGLRAPGPAHILASIRLAEETAVIEAWSRLYLNLHRPELFIVATHDDCGREGANGRNRRVLFQNLAASVKELQRRFPCQKVAGLFIEVDAKRTVNAEGLLLEQIEQRICELEDTDAERAGRDALNTQLAFDGLLEIVRR